MNLHSLFGRKLYASLDNFRKMILLAGFAVCITISAWGEIRLPRLISNCLLYTSPSPRD